jgi:hypothetical protein
MTLSISQELSRKNAENIAPKLKYDLLQKLLSNRKSDKSINSLITELSWNLHIMDDNGDDIFPSGHSLVCGVIISDNFKESTDEEINANIGTAVSFYVADSNFFTSFQDNTYAIWTDGDITDWTKNIMYEKDGKTKEFTIGSGKIKQSESTIDVFMDYQQNYLDRFNMALKNTPSKLPPKAQIYGFDRYFWQWEFDESVPSIYNGEQVKTSAEMFFEIFSDIGGLFLKSQQVDPQQDIFKGIVSILLLNFIFEKENVLNLFTSKDTSIKNIPRLITRYEREGLEAVNRIASSQKTSLVQVTKKLYGPRNNLNTHDRLPHSHPPQVDTFGQYLPSRLPKSFPTIGK